MASLWPDTPERRGPFNFRKSKSQMKQITPRRWLIAARNWYARREARHRAGKAIADAILATSRSVEDALTTICATRGDAMLLMQCQHIANEAAQMVAKHSPDHAAEATARLLYVTAVCADARRAVFDQVEIDALHN